MDNRTKPAESREKRYKVKEILESIESVSYGEIVIAIHDSRVVQIEKREKKRFA